ncbi:tyrosine-type recombinase/integrase [Halobellus rarus]|uniref:Tyrosine-type recombinase/integrase n=1 Tax=Halobellus rarus TaxID=1126237 RepID=A0ABD6CSC1_9EURY
MGSDDLEPITPDAALDYYLDTRRYDLAEDTYSTHRYRLKSFVRWLRSEEYGDGEITNMNDVDLRTIHAFRVFKREENFPDVEPCNAMTMQGQVSTLRAFLRTIAGIDAVPEELPERVMLPRVDGDEEVDETILSAERARTILEHLIQWEYATTHHVAFLLLWRTSCRLGDLRALDLDDFDREEGALSFRHRPSTGTPLKNKSNGERDVSLKPHVVEIVEDYVDGPHREDVRDKYAREPLLPTQHGRPATNTIRTWIYKWTQPCRVGEPCPEGRDPEECEATDHRHITTCPVNVSPHPIRAGSITAHRDAGTPREVVSDRGDVSEQILEKHYDQASERDRMRRRREYIPDNL